MQRSSSIPGYNISRSKLHDILDLELGNNQRLGLELSSPIGLDTVICIGKYNQA